MPHYGEARALGTNVAMSSAVPTLIIHRTYRSKDRSDLLATPISLHDAVPPLIELPHNDAGHGYALPSTSTSLHPCIWHPL